MIDYNLAKKLKDAGFPESKHGYDSFYIDKTDWIIPTLSELIEACGDRLEQLWNVSKDECADNHKWEAHTEGYCIVGSTPEEAVANLWLELNKK